MKGGPQAWDDFEKKPVSVTRACISLDGTRITAVFADNTLCTYDATTGEVILPLFKVSGNPRSVIFSRDGKLVASSGKALRLWNVETGEKVDSFYITGKVYSLAFSPDGTCIAAGCRGRDIDEVDSDVDEEDSDVDEEDSDVDEEDLDVDEEESDVDEEDSDVDEEDSDVDEEDLDVDEEDSDVDEEDLDVDEEDSDVDEEDSDVDEDGRGRYHIRVINLELAKASYFYAHLPSGGEGIKLLKGEVPPSPFEGHGIGVQSVAYSPDGKQIASSTKDGVVRVWDVSTGESRTFDASNGIMKAWNYPVAFSPDGTKLVSDATLINLSTGSCTPGAFRKRLRIISSIAFSADGRFLALGSSGAAFQIWDASTRRMIVQLVGHTDIVSSVDFFPDGKRMMSASEDGTIRVWDVHSALLEGPWEEMDDWGIDTSSIKWNGMIVDSDDKCIFFTPLHFRHARNTLVIGKCMTIDFSNFVYGDEWVKCREPL